MIQRRGFLAGLAGMLGLAHAPIGASEAKAKAAPTMKLTRLPRPYSHGIAGERLWRGQAVYYGQDGKIYACGSGDMWSGQCVIATEEPSGPNKLVVLTP